MCRQFVVLCRQLGLFARAVVAIDGSKFKAVNTRDKNFTVAKIAKRIEQVEASIERYLAALDRRTDRTMMSPRPGRCASKRGSRACGGRCGPSRRWASRSRLRLTAGLADRSRRPVNGDQRPGSGVVGYNVQVAVDTEHHLIVAHEVTNSGSDRSQLANMAKQAKAVLQTEELAAVADRGYFNSPEILECVEAGITVTLPKPMTSGAKSQGRFGKQDFVYVPEKDIYRCPAGEHLTYRFSAEEHGKTIRRYWTTACPKCPLQSRCTTGPERRIPAGNTSTCWTPFRSVSMRARKPCVCAARRSSIRSVP